MKILINKLCIIVLVFARVGESVTMASASQLMKILQVKSLPIKTINDARDALVQSLNNAPKDSVALSAYEKGQNSTLLRCAKILSDNARVQLLETLLEIDNRLAYWQYQKDHPWNYFVSKNPIKWVLGPRQEDEIENSIEVLHNHQGELYVLLGQLSKLENTFIQRYKDTFLVDYNESYKWIDELLGLLMRIKTTTMSTTDAGSFIVRVELLKRKLENVDKFKNALLSDMEETAIPGYLERNWLKMSGSIFTLGYAYNKGLLDQLQESSSIAMNTFKKDVVAPVEETVKDIVTPGWQNASGVKGAKTTDSYATQLELAKKLVREIGDDYGLESEAQKVIQGLDASNYSLFEEFLDTAVDKAKLNLALSAPSKSVKSLQDWLENLKKYGKGVVLHAKLEGAHIAQQYAGQYAAVGRVVLLIPAAIAAGIGGYVGSIGIAKLTGKNYAPLRRALVEVNSLFVDASKQLDDEEYGKMIYLIYNLKKRAIKELPRSKNIQADFIHDLERIESQEFNVAAKRAIVEDMFKKYDFLGLIQQK